MNQIFCLHNYGMPIIWETQKHILGGVHCRTTIRFYYRCSKCGKIKQGKEMDYIEPEKADKLLATQGNELIK